MSDFRPPLPAKFRPDPCRRDPLRNMVLDELDGTSQAQQAPVLAYLDYLYGDLPKEDVTQAYKDAVPVTRKGFQETTISLVNRLVEKHLGEKAVLWTETVRGGRDGAEPTSKLR